MADSIVIQLDLEAGDVKKVVSGLQKAGSKAGEKAGDSFAKNFNKNAGRAITNLGRSAVRATAQVAALGTALGTVFGVKAIQLANEQENAVNRLNTALRTAGDFSLEASKDFQEFASQLQSVTKFGDEVILNNIALAKSFGATNKQAKLVATAAADLAAELGIDLESATRNVAKTLGGYAGELGETIPELKNFTQAQLQAGAGVELLARRFAGAANNEVKTFSGALEQASNAIGDTFEAVGRLITQNPKFAKVINDVKGLFEGLTSAVDSFASRTDVFASLTESVIKFNDAIITYAVAPLELFANIGEFVFKAVRGGLATIVAAVAQVGGAIGRLFSAVGIDNDLTKGLQSFAETATMVSRNQAVETKQAFDDIFNFEISDRLSQKNDQLREYFEEVNQIVADNAVIQDEISTNQVEKAEVHAATIRDVYSGVFDGLTSGVETASNSIEEANARVAEFSKKSGQQLQNGFGRAAGNAFASFGAAVAEGNASLSSFTDALFKSLAQSAVTLGTNFILEGTAYLFSANPTLQALGPSLIGSGAALAAFGGFLGATVGGGGSATAGAGVGGGGAAQGAPVSTAVDTVDPGAVAQAEEQTNLTINVQGSVVQQDDLGEAVAFALSESGARQSTVVTNFRAVNA